MDRNRTVAGLDVHKDSIYLCIMGHEEAIIYEKTYGVLTPELRQMCNDMLDRGVTEAAMESTAVYWLPVWNELCESMELKLVNPYFIKQLPGRKSDVKDAQWIAECLLKNLIRGSFVPEPVVQDMRKLNHRIQTASDHPRCQGTRRHSHNCGDRSGHEDVCHSRSACGMVRTQAQERCQQQTLQKPENHECQQIPAEDPHRDIMDRVKDAELFLLQLQLHTGHTEAQEQDEDTGGNRQKDTCRRMAYAIQRRGLHRHLSQTP